jgi:hypothetical protein
VFTTGTVHGKDDKDDDNGGDSNGNKHNNNNNNNNNKVRVILQLVNIRTHKETHSKPLRKLPLPKVSAMLCHSAIFRLCQRLLQ